MKYALSVSLESGECRIVRRNREAGIPASVWNHEVLEFTLRRRTSLVRLMETKGMKEAVKRLLETASVNWDGSNWVGSFDPAAHEALCAVIYDSGA